MQLNENLIYALESYDISGIKIFCDTYICDAVKLYFLSKFTEEWDTTLLFCETKYGQCETKEEEYMPIHVATKEYGIFIEVGALDVKYANGDFCDLELGIEALDNTLKAVKETYPSIEYEGYIAFSWGDLRGGEIVQYEVSSKQTQSQDLNQCFEFVGEKLAHILETEHHIWFPEEALSAEEFRFVVSGKLECFENREEFVEYIEELGGTVTGSISKKTDYLITNDLASNSSKNKKAKELGIAIITEKEFLSRFGDMDEYDMSEDTSDCLNMLYDISQEASDFWSVLYEQLACQVWEDDFKEIINNLLAHKAWIKEEILQRAIHSLIDIATGMDADMREPLVEYWKSINGR